MDKVKLMYDMARLAFETDSTRPVALLLDSVNSPAIELEGVKITDGYHNLSHHGKSEAKLAQLKAIDEWHMKLLANLFTELKSVREGDDTLFDRTMILYGTNLGERQYARHHQPADHLRRRRFQARPAPGLRPGSQLSPAQPLRLHAPAHGHGSQHVRFLHRHDARPGPHLTIEQNSSRRSQISVTSK